MALDRAALGLGWPDVEMGKMPVRLVGMGTYSLDIEINGYVKMADYDEFLAAQRGCC